MWDDAKHIGFDLETAGEIREYALQPWRVEQDKAFITSIALVRRVGKGKFLTKGGTFPSKRALAAFLQDAIDSKITIVGWNVTFDISWLIAEGLWDLVVRCKWLDGMLLWKHLEVEPEYDQNRAQKKAFGLKHAVTEYMPQWAGYEEDIDFHDFSPSGLAKLQQYNNRDTRFTLQLAKHFYNQLVPTQQTCARTEACALPHIARANLMGMYVDVLRCREIETHQTYIAQTLLHELAPHGVTETIVRSPMQLSNLLFNVWKLPILKKNTSKKTGNETNSTDKEVLHELAFVDPRAKQLRSYREALNARSKFATTVLLSAEYNGDWKAHPQAIPFGTYSGRLTYASAQGKGKDKKQIGFALHQMKRGEMFRQNIEAPAGHDIVEFDAAGQEFRWMAIASGDSTMQQLCQPGEDAHSYMGAEISEKDYREVMTAVKTKEPWAAGPQGVRMMGKVGNLSLQYRTSPPKLRSVARVDYGIPMELPQARVIHLTYQRVYKQVPVYWRNQIQEVKNLGYVETFGGRRVQVVGNWATEGWRMGSTAINYRIQGTGADQKFLAVSVLEPIMLRYDVKFAWDMHDGIYFYVPTKNVSAFAHAGKYLLDNLPYKKAWGFTPPIPLPWDCKSGKTWGSLKEFKFDA